MGDDEEHQKKLARLAQLRQKVENEEALSEEEERELEEMAKDPDMPVTAAE
jgi:hypothetical protein